MARVSLDGREIGYGDTGGSGEAVLLLHAFPLNSKMWEPQVTSLGDRFRLLTPDLPGFGDSSAPDDRTGYSMDRWADDAAAVLADAGVTAATVLGLSMGGYVTFSLWRRNRDLVKALVLADTRSEADPPEGKEKRSGQQKTVEAEGTAPLVEALPGALLGDTTRSSRPEVVERAKEIMGQNTPEAFIGALEAMKNRIDSTGDLAGVDVPTLILVGEEDTLTPPDLSRSMHEHIAGSKLAVLPEAGHLSNLEAPAAFNGALVEFLDAL